VSVRRVIHIDLLRVIIVWGPRAVNGGA
jgi:hypothetical protein